MELTKAYLNLPQKKQLLISSHIAADSMTKDPEFAAKLSSRHKKMEAGAKWRHADVLADLKNISR